MKIIFMSKMTREDLRKELADEYIKWSKEPFDTVTLPDDIVVKFEEALFFSAPAMDKLTVNDIRTILSKTPATLNRLEVGIVCNVILNVPRNILFKDLNDWLVNGSQYSHIRDRFNEADGEKQLYLNKKGETKAKFLNL